MRVSELRRRAGNRLDSLQPLRRWSAVAGRSTFFPQRQQKSGSMEALVGAPMDRNRSDRMDCGGPVLAGHPPLLLAHVLADLAERLLLELTNALARQVVLVADLFQR